MRILFIGDVTGKSGVSYINKILPSLKQQESVDLVVANGENAAWNGRGLTISALEGLYDAGVELITLGNHTWDQKEIYDHLDQDERICRPANFYEKTPGVGFRICKVNGKKVAVINIIGRSFMGLYDCPFQTADRLIEEINKTTSHVLIDFHAETTSEKIAFGWYMAGRASAVVGTHTHVQTADERILPGGTAYISDVGMTGPYNGVLGVSRQAMIRKFMYQMPTRHELEEGLRQFSAVVLTLDDTGRAKSIQRIHMSEE